MTDTHFYVTREAWLVAMTARLTHEVFEPMYEVPKNIRVSCGFPSMRPLNSTKNQCIGQCWSDTSSKDRHFEIFISPILADPIAVAGVLVHEICHAVAGLKAKHGPTFKKVATHCGLTGKMTATTIGDELRAKLVTETKQIGPYPHAELDARKMETTKKKQTTRMLKAECEECGYTVRVSSKWLDVGTPHCPHHGAMSVDNQLDPTEE